MARVEGPPEPMMMPVRSFEISLVLEAGIADRLVHGDVVPGRAAAVEAHGAAVDHLFRIEARGAVDLAAEAELLVIRSLADAGLRLAQRGENFLRVVADGRDDAHPGDDDAPHEPFQPGSWPDPRHVRRIDPNLNRQATAEPVAAPLRGPK